MAGFFDRFTKWLAGSAPVARASDVPVVEPARPPIAPDDPRLPDASRPKVARLASMIADIEARSLDDALLVSALTEVRQMRDTHLRQLIESYASIPAAHRATIFRETGRSASYNLNAALDRMLARLGDLSRLLAQEDIDGFENNLRFIEHLYSGDSPAA